MPTRLRRSICCVVPTLTFERLFAFLVVGHGRRQLLWFAVTRNPSAEWLAQQIAEAFPWNTAPTYLVRDNDRFMSPNKEKLALFIDGANLYATAKSLGFDIDYKRLLCEFQSRGDLLRAFYYTAVIEDQEFSSIRPLIDWLDYNGYTVVTKPTKEFVDQAGRRKIKGNMDIELAVDAMELAGHIDHMVLFSGDGDFRSLVEAVQRRGVRVSVVSTTSTQPPMIADELRRQADQFVEIVELQPKISRDPTERAARETREPRHSLQRGTIQQSAAADEGEFEG
jgi:uncharacterized LabA/DUF88 family protein